MKRKLTGVEVGTTTGDVATYDQVVREGQILFATASDKTEYDGNAVGNVLYDNAGKALATLNIGSVSENNDGFVSGGQVWQNDIQYGSYAVDYGEDGDGSEGGTVTVLNNKGDKAFQITGIMTKASTETTSKYLPYTADERTIQINENKMISAVKGEITDDEQNGGLGLMTGRQMFEELRLKKDGNLLEKTMTTGESLKALDEYVYQNQQALETNTEKITEIQKYFEPTTNPDGTPGTTTIIQQMAGEAAADAVEVTAGNSQINVKKVDKTDENGNVIGATYEIYGLGTSGEGGDSIVNYDTNEGWVSTDFGDEDVQHGTGSTAYGSGANAKGTDSVAIGKDAVATDEGSIAIGAGSEAANGGVAIGDGAVATGENSIAIGKDSVATGENEISFGNDEVKRKLTGVEVGTGTGDVATYDQVVAAKQTLFATTDTSIRGNDQAGNVLYDNAGNALATLSIGTVSETSNGFVSGKQVWANDIAADTYHVEYKNAGADGNDDIGLGTVDVLNNKGEVAFSIDNIKTKVTANDLKGLTTTYNGDNTTIQIDRSGDDDSATISVIKGSVEEDSTGVITGGILYNEVRPLVDGNYYETGMTTADTIRALDTQLSNTNETLNTYGDQITEIQKYFETTTNPDGTPGTTTKIEQIAGGAAANAVKVEAGNNNISVKKVEEKDKDGNVIGATYQISGLGGSGEGGDSIVNYDTTDGWLSTDFGDEDVDHGTNSTAYGYGANAQGDESVAIGHDAVATDEGSVAIGAGAVAKEGSVAIGEGAEATGENSIAIGKGSVATGDNEISFGNEDVQRKLTGVAVGEGSGDVATWDQAVKENQILFAVTGDMSEDYNGNEQGNTLVDNAGNILATLNIGSVSSGNEGFVSGGQVWLNDVKNETYTVKYDETQQGTDSGYVVVKRNDGTQAFRIEGLNTQPTTGEVTPYPAYNGDEQTIHLENGTGRFSAIIGQITDDEQQGGTGLMTGRQIYEEVRPLADGNYIAIDNTTAQNLKALDDQVALNVETLNTYGDQITKIEQYFEPSTDSQGNPTGTTKIEQIAGEAAANAVEVEAGNNNISVKKVNKTDANGNIIGATYQISGLGGSGEGGDSIVNYDTNEGWVSTDFGNDDVDHGTNSTAYGSGANAQGDESVALGHDAVAKGEGSVAIGSGSEASNGGVAIGEGAVATGENSIAIGKGSVATGENEISFGNDEVKRKLTGVEVGTGTGDVATYDQVVAAKQTLFATTDTSIRGNDQAGNVLYDNAGNALATLSIGTVSETSNGFVSGKQVWANDIAADTYHVEYKNAGADGNDDIGLGTVDVLNNKGEVAFSIDNIKTKVTANDLKGLTTTYNGDNTTIQIDRSGDDDSATISVIKGSVEEDSTGVITGGILYNEVRPLVDGNYYETGMTTADTIRALDTQLYETNTTLNTYGDQITEIQKYFETTTNPDGTTTGTTKIEQIAGEAAASAVKVEAGNDNISVTKVEEKDKNGNVIGATYKISGLGGSGEGGGDSIVDYSTADGWVSTDFGDDDVAHGTNSTAYGSGANAKGGDSVAIGHDAVASDEGSIAIGADAVAKDGGVAIGDGASATGENSIAIGKDSVATGKNEISFGNENLKRKLTGVEVGTGTGDVATYDQVVKAKQTLFAVTDDMSKDGGNVKGNVLYDNAGNALATLSIGTVSGSSKGFVSGAQVWANDIKSGTYDVEYRNAGADGDDDMGIGTVDVLNNKGEVAFSIANIKTKVTANDLKGLTTTYNGDNTTIQIDRSDDDDSATISVVTGEIVQDSTGVITGETIYNELRPLTDGNYYETGMTTAETLKNLDTQLYTTNETLNTYGDQITKIEQYFEPTTNPDGTTTGTTKIEQIAGEAAMNAVTVKAGNDNIKVKKVEQTDENGNVVGYEYRISGLGGSGEGGESVVDYSVDDEWLSTDFGDAETTTHGTNSTAYGYGANAQGDDSVAIGHDALATDEGSIAIGSGAVAKDGSVAIGEGASATGENSIAIGKDSVAKGDNEISFGNDEVKRKLTGVQVGEGSGDVATYDQVVRAKQTLFAVTDDMSKVGGNVKGNVLYDNAGNTLATLAIGTISEKSQGFVSGAQVFANDVKNDAYEVEYEEGGTGTTNAYVDVYRNDGSRAFRIKGLNVTPTSDQVKDFKEYSVNGESLYIDPETHEISIVEGGVTEGSKGIATGELLYSELRPLTDGNYYETGMTTAETLKNLDTQVYSNAQAIEDFDTAITELQKNSITTEAGKTEIQKFLKTAVQVKGDDTTTQVKASQDKDGNMTYTVTAIGGGGESVVDYSKTEAWLSTDFDDDNVTHGYNSTAYGYGANAKGADTVAFGYGATADGIGSVAVGQGANATDGAVAIGDGATATGLNSIAIGKGSVATEENEISFGGNGITRKLTNVEFGTTTGDVATWDQLTAANQTIYATTNQVDGKHQGNVLFDNAGNALATFALGTVSKGNKGFVSGGDVWSEIVTNQTGVVKYTKGADGKSYGTVNVLTNGGKTAFTITGIKAEVGEGEASDYIPYTGSETIEISDKNQISVKKGSMQVTEGNEGIVTGGDLYTELRPTQEGSIISTSSTIADNLSALDQQVAANQTAIQNIQDFTNITEAGQTNIKTLAKTAVQVKGVGVIDVSLDESADTDDYTYIVSAQTGEVGEGLTTLVTGDAVNTAIQEAIEEITGGTSGGGSMAQKVGTDASNIGENLKDKDGNDATEEEKQANKDSWGEALGGDIGEGSKQLVTGDTIYQYLTPKDADGNTVSTDELHYIDPTNTAGQNLYNLDTQVYDNTQNITQLQEYFNTTEGGTTKIEQIAGNVAMKAVTVSAGNNGIDVKKIETTDADGNVTSVDYKVFNLRMGNGTEDDTGNSKASAMNYSTEKHYVSTDFGDQSVEHGENSSAYGYEAVARADESVAMGHGAQAGKTEDGTTTGNGAVAIGSQAKAEQDGTIALGKDAVASGEGAIAIGESSEASGKNSVAIGKESVATEDNTVSFGKADASDASKFVSGDRISNIADAVYDHDAVTYGQVKELVGEGSSYVNYNTENKVVNIGGNTVKEGETVYKNSIAIGEGNTVTGEGGVVIGKDGKAGKDAIAVGNGAQATHENSVAIGKDSVSTGTNEVSFGNSTTQRKLTNVADGTSEHDVATYGQVQKVEERVTTVEEAVNTIGNQVNGMEERVGKGVAGAAALAALHPLDYDPMDKLSFSAGYGHYKSANALALGAFYRPSESVLFSLGGAVGNGEDVVNMGVTFSLGRGRTGGTASRAQMAGQIQKLAQENVNLNERINRLERFLQRIVQAGGNRAAADETVAQQIPTV